ncbi:MAG: hypothetical protein WAW17_12065 [Rhodococcus sp. (in: high G+C Gram-positive bacteria)]
MRPGVCARPREDHLRRPARCDPSR